MDDLVVCQLCREPIWNFLCVDCISKNVEKWLPKVFSQQFIKFHQEIKSHFQTTADNYEPCLDCSSLSESPICPHCYTHEAYHWLSAKNPKIAENFQKLFFFYPFEGSEHIKSETDPIGETQNKKIIRGFCDTCSEYSENLEQSQEGWCCESCME